MGEGGGEAAEGGGRETPLLLLLLLALVGLAAPINTGLSGMESSFGIVAS